MQLTQPGLDVVQGLQAAVVQWLQAAGAHQALGDGITGEDQVVATAPGHQLGLEHFAAIHHVVDHLDAGFGRELLESVLGKIVGPVVQAQHGLLGLSLAGADGQRQGGQNVAFHAHALRVCGWVPSRVSSGAYISGRRSR
ncbi:hypothetical protein D3C85_1421820 [compost metagenome]